MNNKFEGRHDSFKVVCKEEHTNFELKKLGGRILQGSEVKCVECGASAIVFDDGGVYKLIESDENIDLKIID